MRFVLASTETHHLHDFGKHGHIRQTSERKCGKRFLCFVFKANNSDTETKTKEQLTEKLRSPLELVCSIERLMDKINSDHLLQEWKARKRSLGILL